MAQIVFLSLPRIHYPLQIGLGNQAEAAVSKLRRLRREEQLRADPGWQERVKGIDQQIEAVMRDVNRGVGGSDFS